MSRSATIFRRGLLLALFSLPAFAQDTSPGRDPSSAPAKSAQTQEEHSPGHFSLSLGIGAAYVIGGIDLAFRLPHVEPFVGVGVGTFFGGVMGGARIFLKRDEVGPFVNLEGGLIFNVGDNDIPVETAFGITGGYRLGFSTYGFVQGGGGVMVLTTRYESGPSTTRVAPDVDFAVGVTF